MIERASDPSSDRPELAQLDLTQLRPYFSITIIECTSDDPRRAFDSLQRFLRREAGKPGRATSVEPLAEVEYGEDGGADTAPIGAFIALGFDRVYGLVRRRTGPPAWAPGDSNFIDTVNQLTLAMTRNRLVAIRTEMISSPALLSWVAKPTTPYRALAPEILDGTFSGDSTMVWLQGVHRRRASKADFKALGGSRLQDAMDPLDDASYAMSAVAINLVPATESAVLRGRLTISSDKSSIAFKSMSTLFDFVVATEETLSMLEKSITTEEPLDATFPELATRERDLSRVRGAYDIRIASPEEIQGMPGADEATVERAELLRSCVLEVEGDPGSAAARVTVGANGASAGRLTVTPEAVRGGGFELSVRLSGTPTDELQTRALRDAFTDGDLVSVYYESGHMIRNRQILRENLNSPAFTSIEFVPFDGFDVMREKPRAYGDQAIHDAIGDDDSLFSWVVARFSPGLLVCDDGAGEIADFLHLDDEGTLTAIHVKGANSKAPTRRIAVTAFEVLVSQATKNIKRLRTEALESALRSPRIPRPACWRDGMRVPDRADFLDELSMRVARDKSRVVLVQPHLLESTYHAARAAVDAGTPGRDGSSLLLLDNLLHSTRRTVVSFWDELGVIGTA
jgi:hypothetical protein